MAANKDYAVDDVNLRDASQALGGKRVGDGGAFGWVNRPLDETGKQVEDGDRVQILVAWPRKKGLSESLLPGSWGKGGTTFDIDGSKNEFLVLVDKENGMWAVAKHYLSADNATRYVVKKSPKGELNLYWTNDDDVLQAPLANRGDWINAYPDYFDEKACSVGVRAQGGGYQLHFESSGREVTSADFCNVKNSGSYLRVFFYNAGHLGDGRPDRLQAARAEADVMGGGPV